VGSGPGREGRPSGRAYGAAAIRRIPGRLHITWQDDSTLRIDTDQGTQTRRLHFGGRAPQGLEPTWQGYSSAQWEGIVARTVVREFFDLSRERNGDTWLVATTHRRGSRVSDDAVRDQHELQETGGRHRMEPDGVRCQAAWVAWVAS
jgi:hypothetical protein